MGALLQWSHIVFAVIQTHPAACVVDESLELPSVERPAASQELEDRHAQRPVVNRLQAETNNRQTVVVVDHAW